MLDALKRRIRTWQDQGRFILFVRLVYFVHRCVRDIRHLVCLPFAMRQMCALEARPGTEALVSLAFDRFLGVIRPLQVRSEVLALLNVLKDAPLRRILEIGTADGGTLFLFCRMATDDAQIISMDLPGGRFGGGYPAWKTRLYEAFALPGQRLELLRADSHDAAALDEVRDLLDGEELDFLFIDGDHTYAGVRKDFEMYGPLVKNGGLIALHDIAEHPARAAGDAHRFWAEIRSQYQVEEFVESWEQGYGIGLIRKGQASGNVPGGDALHTDD